MPLTRSDRRASFPRMNPRLLLLPAFGLVFASCESNGPIRSSFDPLDAAGGYGAQTNVVDTGYRPGEFVSSVTPNTGFYKKRPDGEADADKLLPANTPMKVISDDGSFVKVELDSGEVGYVSTVQVMGQDEAAGTPASGSEVQVWPPPVEGTIPLDTIEEGDPGVPTVPTDIDPDAPVESPLLPDELPEGGDTATDIPPLPEPVDAGEDEEATVDESAAASEE